MRIEDLFEVFFRNSGTAVRHHDPDAVADSSGFKNQFTLPIDGANGIKNQILNHLPDPGWITPQYRGRLLIIPDQTNAIEVKLPVKQLGQVVEQFIEVDLQDHRRHGPDGVQEGIDGFPALKRLP